MEWNIKPRYWKTEDTESELGRMAEEMKPKRSNSNELERPNGKNYSIYFD